ncbi:hypothetical protein EDC14_101059 [Hydrogenispora ethanolica]|jgi:hypothetical protein|uniref:Uncharacterized protein n=1 Tax=Hydrogenispora ethanolica TaxID=1082276 RepID=A0A4R1RVD3_HYDET|nr:hypothetical protein [Hydrogenispora ethanolica]TCL70070.1 hypothetical protein EDC14_101059 [Hydrogenispora ethanolica]
MHKVEKTDYGVRLTLGGFIKEDEMSEWAGESQRILSELPASFGVFLDMRELKPLPPECRPIVIEVQKMFKERGMVRSVAIFADYVTTMQTKRMSKETGIYEWERYLDASAESDWENIGILWVRDGIDPDR